jgi:hypothetical protein
MEGNSPSPIYATLLQWFLSGGFEADRENFSHNSRYRAQIGPTDLPKILSMSAYHSIRMFVETFRIKMYGI